MLDDGHITDSKGRKVSFKNAIIIMTSNAGASRIVDPKNLGFATKTTEQQDYQRMKNGVMEEVKRLFKPEFINRIDEIIVFNALDEDMQAKIAHKFMNELSQRLQRKDIRLQVSDEVYRLIATQGVDPVFGARPMKRYIQRSIETLIARKIIEGGAGKDDLIKLEVKDGDYQVTIEHEA